MMLRRVGLVLAVLGAILLLAGPALAESGTIGPGQSKKFTYSTPTGKGFVIKCSGTCAVLISGVWVPPGYSSNTTFSGRVDMKDGGQKVYEHQGIVWIEFKGRYGTATITETQ